MANLLVFKHLAKEVWQINISAKGLIIVSSNLDGYRLVNHQQFAKVPMPNLPALRYNIILTKANVNMLLCRLLLFPSLQRHP